MRIVRRLVLPLAVLAATATIAGFAVPAWAKAIPAPHYYVALGDSLSQGYQPGLGDTAQGYVDDTYAALKASDPGLILEKFGCSGETSATMVNGGICTYSQGSQLAEAEAFLAAHKANIKFVTLDIGANDVDGCVPNGQVNVTCLSQGLAAVQTNIATILAGINTADGGVARSVGLTYYDPFLAAYLQTGGQQLATLSVTLLGELNGELTSAFASHGFRTADIAAKFRSSDFTTKRAVTGYGTLPRNVSYICQFTYMCSQGNIHANPAGYTLMSQTVRAALNLTPLPT